MHNPPPRALRQLFAGFHGPGGGFYTQGRPPVEKRVVLWQYPERDHSAAVSAGLTTHPFREYADRVMDAQRIARRNGCRPVILRATVAQVLEVLAQHGLPNTPDGRAQAFLILDSERNSPES